MAVPPVKVYPSVQTIRPVNISLQDWADRTTGILQKFGFRQRLMGDDWVPWGMNLVQIMARVRGGQIPRPDQFKDWRDWALRLNQVIGK